MQSGARPALHAGALTWRGRPVSQQRSQPGTWRRVSRVSESPFARGFHKASTSRSWPLKPFFPVRFQMRLFLPSFMFSPNQTPNVRRRCIFPFFFFSYWQSVRPLACFSGDFKLFSRAPMFCGGGSPSICGGVGDFPPVARSRPRDRVRVTGAPNSQRRRSAGPIGLAAAAQAGRGVCIPAAPSLGSTASAVDGRQPELAWEEMLPHR